MLFLIDHLVDDNISQSLVPPLRRLNDIILTLLSGVVNPSLSGNLSLVELRDLVSGVVSAGPPDHRLCALQRRFRFIWNSRLIFYFAGRV